MIIQMLNARWCVTMSSDAVVGSLDFSSQDFKSRVSNPRTIESQISQGLIFTSTRPIACFASTRPLNCKSPNCLFSLQHALWKFKSPRGRAIFPDWTFICIYIYILCAYIYIYIYIYIYTCAYLDILCMYACMYVCMYGCTELLRTGRMPCELSVCSAKSRRVALCRVMQHRVVAHVTLHTWDCTLSCGRSTTHQAKNYKTHATSSLAMCTCPVGCPSDQPWGVRVRKAAYHTSNITTTTTTTTTTTISITSSILTNIITLLLYYFITVLLYYCITMKWGAQDRGSRKLWSRPSRENSNIIP